MYGLHKRAKTKHVTDLMLVLESVLAGFTGRDKKSIEIQPAVDLQADTE